jgi:hypothetical protein
LLAGGSKLNRVLILRHIVVSRTEQAERG